MVVFTDSTKVWKVPKNSQQDGLVWPLSCNDPKSKMMTIQPIPDDVLFLKWWWSWRKDRGSFCSTPKRAKNDVFQAFIDPQKILQNVWNRKSTFAVKSIHVSGIAMIHIIKWTLISLTPETLTAPFPLQPHQITSHGMKSLAQFHSSPRLKIITLTLLTT